MRPIVKLAPGTYINNIDNSQIIIDSVYNTYQDAKPALIFNLGQFCSYCEEAYHQPRDLHVEHVQPKTLYPDLETKWDNFLLSCATCNGTDNKGSKDVDLNEIHLPHLNNTFKSLVYKAGGVVEVNPNLTGLSLSNATNLLNLIRLDKTPKNSCPGDTRWRKRSDDWNIAEIYKKKYNSGTIDIDTIVDLVKNRGGWSIWFTVFKGCDEVRKALIDEFPGTAKDCFDPNNGYEPIDRNPGQPDPV